MPIYAPRLSAQTVIMYEDNPQHRDALTTALLILSSVLLPLGLLLPALRTTQFAFWSGEHSILGFGYALLAGGELALAAIVWIFSIAFPLTKLIWMWRLTGRLPIHRNTIRRLEMLGKWSMADVLVIALVVFSARGSAVFQAEPAIGLYAFTLSVLLTMLASGRIASQFDRQSSPPTDQE